MNSCKIQIESSPKLFDVIFNEMTDLHTHRPYMPEKYRATYRKLDEYQNEIQ